MLPTYVALPKVTLHQNRIQKSAMSLLQCGEYRYVKAANNSSNNLCSCFWFKILTAVSHLLVFLRRVLILLDASLFNEISEISYWHCSSKMLQVRHWAIGKLLRTLPDSPDIPGHCQTSLNVAGLPRMLPVVPERFRTSPNVAGRPRTLPEFSRFYRKSLSWSILS